MLVKPTKVLVKQDMRSEQSVEDQEFRREEHDIKFFKAGLASAGT